MKELEYANLHHKTHYSCGQAIGSVEDGIKHAKESGLYGLSFTDYCSLGGGIDAYNVGKKYNFPISIGCELNYYIDGCDNYKIVLMAKNQVGYRNLCKIISFSYENLHKFKEPTCSIADIQDFSEGLLCLTGGIDGVWGKDYLSYPRNEAYSKAVSRVLTLHLIFKDDLYLELTISNQSFQFDYGIQDYCKKYEKNPLIDSNNDIISFSKQNNIKIVITSDSMIPKEADKILQDVCVRNSIEGKRGFYVRENRHICSTQELIATSTLFGLSKRVVKEAMNNTREVIDKCKDIDLSFKDQVVNYPIITHPLHKDGMNKKALVSAIITGYGRMKNDPEYYERLKYELSTITDNGKIDLIDYFLVIEDLCRACRENGVTVGPGRGSGAGSLLNYCLMITHLDPISNGLLFERFISQARIIKGTYPDIDLDFSDQKWAKAYLVKKYGADRVVPIGTMQTMRTKTAIKDSFKLYYPDTSFTIVNKITTSFPKKEELESEPEFYERALKEDDGIKKVLFDTYPKIGECVSRLIGFNRQVGRHPCGLAITQDPINTLIPIRTIKNEKCLDFNLSNSESVGVIKYDILSLTTLKYIATAVSMIKERHNINIDIYNIPINDQDVFNKFALGDTESVFQFNSDIARNILTKIKIESLDDLSLVTSVGRPGPMQNQQHVEFINRKNGDLECVSPHNSLNKSLKDTYGIMIYQESVMKASQILGGFSLAEADDIRKAMGKKKKSILKPYKERFIQNAQKEYTDINKDKAEEIWHLMETFAGYGFNKCLSGDTLVTRGCSSGNGSPQSFEIQHLYKLVNDNEYVKKTGKVHYAKKLRRYGYGSILAPNNDNKIRPRPIKNITYTGKKELFKVVTVSGKSIKGSIDHRLHTNHGDIEIGQLINRMDIKIAVNLGTEKQTKPRTESENRGYIHKNINYTNTKGSKGFQSGKLNHGYIDGRYIEYNKRKEELACQLSCSNCGIYFTKIIKPEHHHKDGNPINNNINNISKLCNSCHKKEDYKIGKRVVKYSKGLLIGYEQILSITKVGLEDTYDVEMEDSPNLFVANNIISHNSHSICYAYIGYICQYLKTYYPMEWWFSCLTHSIDKNEKFSSYYDAAFDLVRLPDINKSTDEFYITEDNIIQMPFSVVKGVGIKANDEIYNNRPFTSLEDFFKRVNKRIINKTIFVRLIFSGAFNSFGLSKEELIDEYFLRLRKDKEIPDKLCHINKENRINLEQESLDFIRVNYYNIYSKAFDSEYLVKLDELINGMDGQVVVVGGKIKSATFLKTKKNTEYCNLIIENNKHEINLKLWENECIKYKKLLNKDKVIWVKGKLSFWLSRPQVAVTHLRTIEEQLRIIYNGGI